MLTQADFWQVIKHIPQLIKDEEDSNYALYTAELKEVLGSTMEPANIKQWIEIFCDFRSKLDILEIDLAIDQHYAGLEDEELEYFKDWIVSRGQSDYEAVLENPDYLKQLVQTCINCLYGDFAEIPFMIWDDLYKSELGEMVEYTQEI